MNSSFSSMLSLLIPLAFAVVGVVVFCRVRGKYKLTKQSLKPTETGSPSEEQSSPVLKSPSASVCSSSDRIKGNKALSSHTGESRLFSLAQMPRAQLANDRSAILISTYIKQVLSTGSDEVLVGELLHLVSSQNCTFNRKLAVGLATVVEALGFGIAPDPRIHGVKPHTTGVIKIFPLAEYESATVADEFHRVVVVVHLTSMVSKADELVLESEKQLARMVIQSNTSFTPYERTSLEALFEWCFSNSFGYRGIKRNIQKLNHSEKLSVWEHLVRVAIVDKKLDVRELAELQKIYDVLDLDPSKKHIYLAAVSNEILTAKRAQREVVEFDKNTPSGHFTRVIHSVGNSRFSDGKPHSIEGSDEGIEGFHLDFEQEIDFDVDDDNCSGLQERGGRAWTGSPHVVDGTIQSLDGGEDFDSSPWFDTAIGR